MADNPLHIRFADGKWNSATGDIRRTLADWTWPETAETSDSILFDFRDVGAVEPWAQALFATFARSLMLRQMPRIAFKSDSTSEALMRAVSLSLPERRHTEDTNPDSTGLQVLKSVRESETFADRASALVDADDAAAEQIKYCVREIGRNIVQHSASPGGGVAVAERIRSHRAIQIALCDSGIGIRASLQPYYPEIATDIEALRLAVLPHTSGARPPGPYGGVENQGLGLFFSREIAWRAGGSFWLASGDALSGVAGNGENGPARTYEKIQTWRGTLAVLQIPDQALVDFEAIFEICHNLAREARREPALIGLDFLDDSAESAGDAIALRIADVADELEAAHRMRAECIDPALRAGKQIVLDFAGVRFLSTSTAQALLGDAFKLPGSLTKLAFRNCTNSTQLAIRTTAALARAKYRLRPE